MLEVIGFFIVCWIGFSLLKGFFKGVSTVRSQEYGMEARNIALRELNVPDAFYSHLTISNIDGVKNAAVLLRDTNNDFKHVSWPRLLAVVIYGEFHKDCVQWQAGNPIPQQLFIQLRIMPNIIAEELERDARQVMYWCIQAGEDYSKASDEDIKHLILRCAEASSTDFNYPNLPYERISDFAFAHECGLECFPSYSGMRFWTNINDATYAVYVDTIDPSKENSSGVIVSACKV